MNSTIFKYEVPAASLREISLPKDSKFLSVGIQDGCPVMWFLVLPSAIKETRTFTAIGTGWEIDFQGLYLGTCQDVNRGLVWHIFEI